MRAVSIIVPVLNDSAALVRLLHALQPLRHQGAEVIVVDGGSCEPVDGVCRGAADVLLSSPPGRALQMNKGAAHARAPVLWFLHADSVPPLDALAKILRATLAHPWGRFDVMIDGRSRWLPVVAALMNRRSRYSGVATGDQGLFFRADAFGSLGGFAELPLMEDVELTRRARRLGPPACLRARIITSGRRWDTHGAWRTIALMWWLRFQFWCGADACRLHTRYYAPTSSSRNRT